MFEEQYRFVCWVCYDYEISSIRYVSNESRNSYHTHRVQQPSPINLKNILIKKLFFIEIG